jgi:hypothetical protein
MNGGNMKTNIGGMDRLVRIIAGFVLLYFAFQKGEWWGWLGFLPIATALVGWCPLYSLLKISSCGKGGGCGCGCGCGPKRGA